MRRRAFLKLAALAALGLTLLPLTPALPRWLRGLVVGADGERFYYLDSWQEETPWLDGPVTFVGP